MVSRCLCLIGKPNDYQVKPHTRLLYEAGDGTNVWFHSYMRCRMKPNEDFTFNRYRVVKQAGKVKGHVQEIEMKRGVLEITLFGAMLLSILGCGSSAIEEITFGLSKGYCAQFSGVCMVLFSMVTLLYTVKVWRNG